HVNLFRLINPPQKNLEEGFARLRHRLPIVYIARKHARRDVYVSSCVCVRRRSVRRTGFSVRYFEFLQRMSLGIKNDSVEVERLVVLKQQVEILQSLGEKKTRHVITFFLRHHTL